MSKVESNVGSKVHRRRLVVLAVLATTAFGCELAVDFDRSKIDGGAFDASVDAPKDQTAQDANGSDGTVRDGDVVDEGAPDTALPDATDARDAADASRADADAAPLDAAGNDADAAATDASDGAPVDADVTDAAADAIDLDVADVTIPGDGAAACNALNESGLVTVTVAEQQAAAPTFLGGPIPNGTYVATAITDYVGDAGAPHGRASSRLRSKWEITGPVVQRLEERVEADAGVTVLRRETFALGTSPNGSLTATTTCPLGPSGGVSTVGGFSVFAADAGEAGTITTLDISLDGVEVYTLRLQ